MLVLSSSSIKKKYCALLPHVQINAEFLRVTAVPLLTRFMAQLDKYSTQLLKIIRRRKGQPKQKLPLSWSFLIRCDLYN